MRKLSIIGAVLLGCMSQQVLAERVVIQVDERKKGVVKALVHQLGGEIKVDSQGFIASEFSGQDLESIKGLLNNPHIKLVELDQPRKLLSLYNDDTGNPADVQVTPYAYYQSQAGDVTLDTSADTKVCVIDSGLDMSNDDFVWASITGDNDSGTGNWFDHGGPHGTHVAGTVAAADNGFGVIGMAPGVPMHIIKVFNAAGWGYSSDLAHAANLCSAAGANIISMSLGGGRANSTEENAFKQFSEAGGLVVAAAGNDGNNVRSYPAGYSSVMMVGANDADNNIADFSQFPTCLTGRGKRQQHDETICVEVTAGGVNTLSTYPEGLATTESLSADGNDYAAAAMENLGTASATTYFMGIGDTVDTAASGSICMIDRGTISFYDKVKNCQDSGGIGAVIINNEPGMLYGTLGETNDTSIPAVGAAQEDRAPLLAATNASIAIGPADYGFMSGTSMATPAVSGVAALVWSNFPACTGEEIRSALKATAEDAGAAGKDDYFGYGIVKAKAAFDHLTSIGCDADNNGGGGGGGGDFSLTANGYKQRGLQKVDLTWSGASSANVDIFRDGNLIDSVANSGAYTDNLNIKGGGSYNYQVCEAGSSVCTESVTVVF